LRHAWFSVCFNLGPANRSRDPMFSDREARVRIYFCFAELHIAR
jgi:hypothetical protein